MIKRKGRGRPRKGARAGKTATFSTRIHPDLRERLENAADRSGGSLSDEIERRLWASFEKQDIQDRMLADFGGPQNVAVCRLVADLMKSVAAAAGKGWADDPWLYAQVRAGIERLLRAWAPAGEPEAPAIRNPLFAEHGDVLGERLAGAILTTLAFADDEAPGAPVDPWAALRRDLGALAERWNNHG